jgi:hypothetical protein
MPKVDSSSAAPQCDTVVAGSTISKEGTAGRKVGEGVNTHRENIFVDDAMSPTGNVVIPVPEMSRTLKMIRVCARHGKLLAIEINDCRGPPVH